MKLGKKIKIPKPPEFEKISNEVEFGNLIRYKRTKIGLTVVKAAALCNISDTTLTKLENGYLGTRLSTALKVAKMLGIKIKFEE